jgi:hypothetical protein
MMLSQFDNEVLKHLEDLVVEEAEEGEDYKVIFVSFLLMFLRCLGVGERVIEYPHPFLF